MAERFAAAVPGAGGGGARGRARARRIRAGSSLAMRIAAPACDAAGAPPCARRRVARADLDDVVEPGHPHRRHRWLLAAIAELALLIVPPAGDTAGIEQRAGMIGAEGELLHTPKGCCT